MKAVGVKTLKSRLSEYLRLVKSGETVLITDRDEVVAEIRPTQRQNLPVSNLDELLLTCAEKGEVTLRSDDSKSWPVLKPLSHAPGITSKEMLDLLRKETK